MVAQILGSTPIFPFSLNNIGGAKASKAKSNGQAQQNYNQQSAAGYQQSAGYQQQNSYQQPAGYQQPNSYQPPQEPEVSQLNLQDYAFYPFTISYSTVCIL